MTSDEGNRFDQLADATKRLAALGEEIAELSVLRRDLARALHEDGYSHARIAEAAGLSRGRIFQILRARRETGW